MNEFKYNRLFKNFVYDIAKESSAKKLKVGCAIVKDNRVISMGYNGTPARMPGSTGNQCEAIVDGSGGLKTHDWVSHAEENAISHLAKGNESSLGADIYITHSPCMACARMIHAAGIRRIFYCEEFRDTRGLDLLCYLDHDVYKLW